MRTILLTVTMAFVLGSTVANAAPEPQDPKKQTSWGLYLTAAEAVAMKREKGKGVLFVDVREPVEIMFTGYTDMIDVNVPYLLVNPAKWNPKKPVLMMEKNPDFAAGIERALKAKGLRKSAPIILMCRSGGTRGAPSAKALAGKGFEKVYVVVDGFEGPTAKDDPKGPWRTVKGWKNTGLPWSYKLNREKIYLRPSR